MTCYMKKTLYILKEQQCRIYMCVPYIYFIFIKKKQNDTYFISNQQKSYQTRQNSYLL